MAHIQYNKEFFSEVNPLNSYWAGFIAADGCLTNKPSCRVVLNLSREDKSHLERFMSDTDHNGFVYESKSKKRRTGEGYDLKSYLYFGSAYKWHEDLGKNFNIFPNKSLTLEPPILKDRLPFIIGYIDGDGCIGKYLDSRGSKYHTTIKILGTHNILSWIKESFDELTPSNTKAKVNPQSKIFQYRIQGKRAVEIFSILNNVDVPKLERKWDNNE